MADGASQASQLVLLHLVLLHLVLLHLVLLHLVLLHLVLPLHLVSPKSDHHPGVRLLTLPATPAHFSRPNKI